jgi:DNA gyrase subunit A
MLQKMGIIIKELPFTVGPEKVVERIADLAKAKKLQGIALSTSPTVKLAPM